MELLKPDFLFNCITDITPQFLKDNNIKGLLLDVDNTLTYEHKSKVLRKDTEEWISIMRKSDIGLIILSNAKQQRAKAFADSIGLDAVGMSVKPLPFGYLRAKKRLKLKAAELAMIGDQIFTDTLGANFLGITSIMVTDITPEQTLSFRIRRTLEKKILKGVK